MKQKSHQSNSETLLEALRGQARIANKSTDSAFFAAMGEIIFRAER